MVSRALQLYSGWVFRYGYNDPRLTYLDENPERAGFVDHSIDWEHGSAIDNYTEKAKGLLDFTLESTEEFLMISLLFRVTVSVAIV